MASWFRDKDFQKHLVTFICRDRNFLKKCGGLLQPKDFRPNRDESDERWIVATQALEFWHKYRQPIGGMLRPNIVDFVRKNNVDEVRRKKLYKLVDYINSGEKLVAVEAMEDRVIEYLRDKKMKDSIEKLIERQEEGSLDNEYFVRVCREVIEWSGKPKRLVSKFLDREALEHRISRRRVSIKNKRPLLLIDELDAKTKIIARGDLGLVIALYKKGKSAMLAHIADAYAKQGLKVIYITLEDPIDEVEDRMDAALTGIPIDKLNDLPNKLRKRFKKFSAKISGKIRIVDATDEGISVDEIEETWERLRDEGFDADVIIVDYDDEIKPPRTHKGESSRRMEFADIYRALRKLASRRSLIIWTAAQTKRIGENTKIITGDKLAEDVSKIRKATIAIGIGQGEHHEDARYLYVAAHKRGRSRFGFEIMCSMNKGLFYDRERTYAMQKAKKQNRDTEA